MWKIVLPVVLWLVAAYFLKFDAVFIAVSIIFGIFYNLGKREAGQWSAYAVFNRGQQRLLGDLRGEQIEGEIRRRDVKSESVSVKERLRVLQARRYELEQEIDKYTIG